MKIVFFAPYAAIWQQALPEALIAKSLKQKGNEILYVSCNGILSNNCLAMKAQGTENTISARKAICKSCRKNQKLIVNSFSFSTVSIEELLTKEAQDVISKAIDYIQPMGEAAYLEGVPIGSYALYLVMLNNKLDSVELDESCLKEYYSELKQSLIVHSVTKRLLETYKPDRTMIYSPVYPTNRVFSKMSELSNIPTYWLHAGANWRDRLKTLIICRNDTPIWILNLIKHWRKSYHNKRLTSEAIQSVYAHFETLLKASSIFVYSSKINHKINIKEKFNINESQKVVLAALSSEDEKIAAEIVGAFPKLKFCFTSQEEWLEELISFFKDKQEYFLIIRVHPRIFPNKRESVKSQLASRLENLFKNLPSNVKINWPSDMISLYQFIPYLDLCLHSGSSVGKEVTLFGIPTVNYLTEVIAYPHDLSFYAQTKVEYFKAIKEAIHSGRDYSLALKTFRWHALEYYYSMIYLTKSNEFLEKSHSKNLLSRIYRKLKRLLLPMYDRKRDVNSFLNAEMSFSDEIHRLLEEEKETILDYRDLEYVDLLSEEQEREHILSAVGNLYKILKIESSQYLMFNFIQ